MKRVSLLHWINSVPLSSALFRFLSAASPAFDANRTMATQNKERNDPRRIMTSYQDNTAMVNSYSVERMAMALATRHRPLAAKLGQLARQIGRSLRHL